MDILDCSANAHTMATYCCKTIWDRLIKIPLFTALEQTAELGKTMNIHELSPIPIFGFTIQLV